MSKLIKNDKKTRNYRSKILLSFFMILIILALLTFYFITKSNNPNIAISNPNIRITGATSTPTQKPIVKSGPDSINNQPGGIIDQNGGTTPSLPPASQWASSSSGDITLQEPVSGALLSTGDSMIGLAKVSNVQFILTDDTVGLIAQGNLRVVNGKFNGILKFSSHSSIGRLEVYYPNPNNGAQEDIVDVSVKFNQ